MINVLILEDDAFEAMILKEYLESHNFNVVKVTKDVAESIEVYHSNVIDFIIIDIFLNGKPDGITFAKTLIKGTRSDVPFLFLTGHSERPIFEEAKTTQPYGYILKPFNEGELAYAIELILDKHNARVDNTKEKESTNFTPYFFKKNAVFYKVVPNDISFIEVEGRYCKINTPQNDFLVQDSLTDFQERLPSSFLRVHRNFVVNTTKIKEVYSKDNLIVLENNKTISLGRSYKKDFFEGYTIIV